MSLKQPEMISTDTCRLLDIQFNSATYVILSSKRQSAKSWFCQRSFWEAFATGMLGQFETSFSLVIRFLMNRTAISKIDIGFHVESMSIQLARNVDRSSCLPLVVSGRLTVLHSFACDPIMAAKTLLRDPDIWPYRIAVLVCFKPKGTVINRLWLLLTAVCYWKLVFCHMRLHGPSKTKGHKEFRSFCGVPSWFLTTLMKQSFDPRLAAF